MPTYALIQNGVVINIIAWDGDTATWEPPAGIAVAAVPEDSSAGIGWTYNGTTFSAPASE
jgi:hypothetical protein